MLLKLFEKYYKVSNIDVKGSVNTRASASALVFTVNNSRTREASGSSALQRQVYVLLIQ